MSLTTKCSRSWWKSVSSCFLSCHTHRDDDRKIDIGYKTNAGSTNIMCLNTKAAQSRSLGAVSASVCVACVVHCGISGPTESLILCNSMRIFWARKLSLSNFHLSLMRAHRHTYTHLSCFKFLKVDCNFILVCVLK